MIKPVKLTLIYLSINRTPGALFVMDLINDGTEDMTVDLMFNFPDQLIGYDLLTPVSTNGYVINNEGRISVASGNITVTA